MELGNKTITLLYLMPEQSIDQKCLPAVQENSLVSSIALGRWPQAIEHTELFPVHREQYSVYFPRMHLNVNTLITLVKLRIV